MPKKCGNFASTTKLASSGLSLYLFCLVALLFACARVCERLRQLKFVKLATLLRFLRRNSFHQFPVGFVIKKHTIVEVRCGGSIRGKGLAALPFCWFQALFTSNYCGKNGRLS